MVAAGCHASRICDLATENENNAAILVVRFGLETV